ncbi:hypothetical protein HGA92_00640 [Candidatus Gracilibacteria bacterium]|nr:hypothetical protein [Candidatus Gracilibacteria bacterium]NUJ98884.1 hypothetical protein [Candidatus Gracilibacteria bacterium]
MEKNKILQIFQRFGLTQKQGEIFLFLYQYGKNPASIVAKGVGMERTNTYKSLKKLVYKGIIAELSIKGIKYFFISDKKIFSHKIEEEKKNLQEKQKHLPLLESEFIKLDKNETSPLPSMRFFQGKEEMKYFFEDIYNTVRESGYVMIKMFASNTLENKTTNSSIFLDYSGDFIKKLKKNKINIEVYLGNGILNLESIIKSYNIDELENLPASSSAIQMYLFGDFIYIAIFKSVPFGIKIESQEFAQMLHFLFKNIHTKN